MGSRELFIFGAGGHAREAAQIVADINAAEPTFHLLGFVVDDGFEDIATVRGLPVQALTPWLRRRAACEMVVAIGSPAVRKRVVDRLVHEGVDRFATLIHPRAWIGTHVRMGRGAVVFGGACVTADVHFGNHVHVNAGCTVSHDSVLEDYATLGPGARTCGNTVVREGAELGAGSVLIPRTSVGKWSIVGAGAVVTEPLNANVTAVGAPARVVKTREPGWQEHDPD